MSCWFNLGIPCRPWRVWISSRKLCPSKGESTTLSGIFTHQSHISKSLTASLRQWRRRRACGLSRRQEKLEKLIEIFQRGGNYVADFWPYTYRYHWGYFWQRNKTMAKRKCRPYPENVHHILPNWGRGREVPFENFQIITHFGSWTLNS